MANWARSTNFAGSGLLVLVFLLDLYEQHMSYIVRLTIGFTVRDINGA